MSRYNTILNQVFRKLGKQVTRDDQLTKYGKISLGTSYIGTFSQDHPLRQLTGKRKYFIINVDKSNKPGSHWVSVFYSGTKFYIYDSFGRRSSKLLPHFIKTIGYKYADADYDAEQKVKQNSCGQRSLAWLLFVHRYGIQQAMKI